MKSMDLHQDHNNATSNMVSAMLFVCAWTMDFLKDIQVSDALSMLFQLLSILSVSLIIVINFPKAMRVLFPSKYKKKEDADKH